MVTGIVVFAAVCLVVVTVQVSCLFSSKEPKKEVELPATACPEV